MQLLETMYIVFACLCGLAFMVNIISDETDMVAVFESILWGVLSIVAINVGGSFAFVCGIIITVLLGLNTLIDLGQVKAQFFAHLPLFIFFLVGLTKFTY